MQLFAGEATSGPDPSWSRQTGINSRHFREAENNPKMQQPASSLNTMDMRFAKLNLSELEHISGPHVIR